MTLEAIIVAALAVSFVIFLLSMAVALLVAAKNDWDANSWRRR